MFGNVNVLRVCFGVLLHKGGKKGDACLLSTPKSQGNVYLLLSPGLLCASGPVFGKFY